MLQDLRIEKEDLQALLDEMEKRGFVATTLHEIRTFTIEQRRTKRAFDGLQHGKMFNPYDLEEIAKIDEIINRRK